MSFRILACSSFLFTDAAFTQAATPGSDLEPIRYVGESAVTRHRHDGALPLVVGVHSFQIFRANRGNLDEGNGKGWTYNHSPNACYWKDRFFCESIALPVNEADWPPHGQANRILSWSQNGRDWEKPMEAFPSVPVDAIPGMGGKHSEQISRSAFYIASNGRLLMHTSLGTSGNKAVGRLIREVYDTVPPTLGPTHFIRYYSHGGFTAETTASTGITFYQTSADAGFMAACDDLLSRSMVTENWWEDELNSQREEGPLRPTDGFYKVPYQKGEVEDNFVKAMWTFQRKDGNWLAGWKNGAFAVFDTPSGSWTPPRFPRSIVTSSAKSWGQRTPDGRYALVYNPTSDNYRRWPLSLTTSDDGIRFDDLGTIFGDVPWPRYKGGNKELGPQYNRGIEPWNGTPPGDGFWIFHSVNKEDLWATRVPTPTRTRVTVPVEDDFENLEEGTLVIPNWNIYRPRWAPVDLVTFDGGKCLRLHDREPGDYAKAARVFPETNSVTVSLKIRPSQKNGQLDIDMLTPDGYRPVRVSFDIDGNFKATHGDEIKTLGRYQENAWTTVTITADATTGTYAVTAGSLKSAGLAFAEPATSFGRLELRTGSFRTVPILGTNPYAPADLPDSEAPSPGFTFHIDNVTTNTGSRAPRLLDAASDGRERVFLSFDRPLNPAPDASRFILDPAIPVKSAILQSSGKNVVLTLDKELTAGIRHTITLEGVERSRTFIIPTAPPTGNLRLWLHAGAGVTSDEGGHITTWVDQSASGNDLTNISESTDSKPRLVPNLLKSHPALRFDGGDHLSRDITGLIADKAGVFVVFKANRPASNQFIFDTAEDSQLSRHQFYQDSNWLQFRVDRNGGAINHDAHANDAFILASYVMNGSASFSRINADHHRVGAFSDYGNHGRYTQIPAASGSPFVLGARYTRDSGFYQGDIAEILIYDQAPQPAEAREIEAYLMHKYFAK